MLGTSDKKTVTEKLEFLIVKCESACDLVLAARSFQCIYQLGYSFSDS